MQIKFKRLFYGAALAVIAFMPDTLAQIPYGAPATSGILNSTFGAKNYANTWSLLNTFNTATVTGSLLAPTMTFTDNSTNAATTAFVKGQNYITASGAPVQSVFGRTGVITSTGGDYSTSQVNEGSNLYFTNARALSSTLTGFTSGTGTISSSDTILTALQKDAGNSSANAANIATNTSNIASNTTAIAGKEPSITSGTSAQYWRGDKTFQTLDTSVVPENGNQYHTNARSIGSLLTGYTSGAGTILATDTVINGIQKNAGNIAVNTTNIASNTSSIAGKEPSITSGTTSQYWRGDKSFQTLDKTAVGLSSVDNTSDVNKPVSTAAQTALNLKSNTASPTFTGTVTTPNLAINSILTLGQTTDSTATGSSAALSLITPTDVLTNASLASVGSITSPSAGYTSVIVNKTGATFSVLNEDVGSATTSNRILTGTGSNLALLNNASVLLSYQANDSRWHIVGGSGGGGGASVPLITKGDTLTYSTVNARHAVPVDNGVLIADSTQADGWRSTSFSETQGKPGKNLIQYSDIENQSTTGFSLGTTGTLINGLTTGTPNFGVPGIPLALTASTSSPIEGTAHLLITSGGASTAGNMIATQQIPIPASYRGKVVTISHLYSILSGAQNLNFSGTSANSLAIALYDFSNSTFIPVVGAFNYTQSNLVPTASATAQIPTNTTSVMVCVYFPNASTGAFTLALKNFYLGITPQVVGPIVTDPVAYIPSFIGFGTPTGIDFISWRNGRFLKIQGKFISGTTSGITGQITLGSSGANANVTVDPTAILTSRIVGKGNGSGAASTTFGGKTVIAAAGNSYLTFGVEDSTAGDATTGQTGANLISSGQTFMFYAEVPIQGWSSNVQMSSDSSGRVVEFSVNASTTAGSASTPLIFTNVLDDTNGSYNVATGQYKISESGRYHFETVQYYGASSFSPTIFKNGAIIAQGVATVSSASVGFASYTGNFVAGDLVDARPSGTATAVSTSAYLNSFSGFKLQGPAVIAATESVNAVYNTSVSVISASQTPLAYTNKIRDSHNAYNTSTGIYTVPVSGLYQVNGAFISQSSTIRTYIALTKAGTEYARGTDYGNLSGSFITNNIVSHMVYCLAGEQISINAYSNSSQTLLGRPESNYFSIARVGN